MALSNEEMDIKIKASVDATSVGQLKKSIKELEDAALQAGDTSSDAFRQITKAAGEARDRLNDAKGAIKEMSGEPLQNLLSGFNGLKSSIMSMDLKGFKTSLGAVKTSFMELTATMLANPIFLIAAVIAAVVVGLYQLKDAGGAVGKVFDFIKEKVDLVIGALKSMLDWLGLTDFKGQESAKKAKENAEIEKKAMEDKAETDRKLAAEKEKRDEKAQQDYLRRLQEKKDALQKHNEEIAKLEDEYYFNDRDKLIKKYQDDYNLAKGNQQLQKEIALQGQSALDAFDKEISDKKAADKKAVDQKKWADYIADYNRKKALDEQALKDFEENQEVYKELVEKNHRDISEVDAAFEKARQEGFTGSFKEWSRVYLEETNKVSSTIKSITEQLKSSFDVIFQAGAGLEGMGQSILESTSNIVTSLGDMFTTFFNENASGTDKIMAGLQAAGAVVSSIGDIMSAVSKNNLININNEKNAKLAALYKQRDAGVITEAQMKNGVSKINDEFRKKEYEAKKKAFKKDKAIRIVQAVIGTAQGVISGLANPFPLNIVMAALNAAAGIAQIAVIASQKFPEGEAAAPSSVSTPSMGDVGGGPEAAKPDTPAFQAPTFFGLGQNNLLNGGANGDTRVYVVESDITNTQDRVAKIRERATLGG